MINNDYIGNEFQIYGKEEYILTSAFASGVKIWHVKNGLGLDLYLNLDRGFDIVFLTINGVNVNYLSPIGYVSSKYYDDKGDGFLISFSAGFLTTCGLTQVGSPNKDNNVDLPLHGTYSNIPVTNARYEDEEDVLILSAEIHDERIFSYKLVLKRKIIISKKENSFILQDEIINKGDEITPLEILYHMNIGYPYLDEDTILKINSNKVVGRDDFAQKDINNWDLMHKPIPCINEKCYYHTFIDDDALATVYQPKLGRGVKISFNSHNLHFLTQWKMLRVRDYVLGLEPGNCTPDGRNVMREKGLLDFIKPNEKKTFSFRVDFYKD